MTLGRVAWLLGLAILVLVANVAVSVIYMVVYSHLIDPGHDAPYYQAHVQIAAPYCSIAAGIPLMFLAGWWVAGWWQGALGVQAALVVWAAYALIDVAVSLAAGLSTRAAVFVGVSILTKLAAAYFGGLAGTPRA